MGNSPVENLWGISNKVLDRFLAKVDRNGPNGCWLWKGATNPGGYGICTITKRQITAHRASYMLAKGTLPSHLHLHHKIEDGCVGPACVNPEHLEPLTPDEHEARHGREGWVYPSRLGAFCFKGHPYDPETTIIRNNGTRMCRVCLEQSGMHGPRVTHCPQGHPLSGENLYEHRKGAVTYRICRECSRTAARNRARKIRAKERAEHPPKPPRTHCSKGHELTPDNTYTKDGVRLCCECRRAGDRRRYVAHPSERILKTHCKYGHSLADAFPVKNKDGRIGRKCRECSRIASLAAYYSRKSALS